MEKIVAWTSSIKTDTKKERTDALTDDNEAQHTQEPTVNQASVVQHQQGKKAKKASRAKRPHSKASIDLTKEPAKEKTAQAYGYVYWWRQPKPENLGTCRSHNGALQAF